MKSRVLRDGADSRLFKGDELQDSLLVTAALLVIGDEILSGRTKDSNGSFLASALSDLGIALREIRVVPDDESEIVGAVQTLSQKYRYLFTTGGIGPTHDDITTACVAKAFGRKVEQSGEAYRRLYEYYGGSARLTKARLRMAQVPRGAQLIDNPLTAAPGFIVENVHVMAGPPKIVQAMFDSLIPRLVGGKPLICRNYETTVEEGDIAGELAEIAARYPSVSIGSYPSMDKEGCGLRLVARSTSVQALNNCDDELRALLKALSS